ncbi:MAG: DNA gyrase inhibitor YacG [Pseudomonadota bacterium]
MIEKTCPMCDKPIDARYKPFCSKRCADRDLNRWLSGAYAIPASEEFPSEVDAQETDN